MRFTTSFIAVPLLLLAFCGHIRATTGEADLNRLASLAGEWSLLDPEGEPSSLSATYRVIAGGSAVLETLLAGTPQETVTIYHLEGNRLAATQISRRSAPTRFALRGADDRSTLLFEAEAAEHETKGGLQVLQLTLIDEDHLRVEWSLTTENGSLESTVFELSREASLEELTAEVARLRVDLESLQRELDRRLKREITVARKGKSDKVFLETRTLPSGPGWNVSGVPFRLFLHKQTTQFASTYASEGDRGMTIGHYGFKAGSGCTIRFSVLGGHGYVAVVEDTKLPPRRIGSIPDFSLKLESGAYGKIIERIVGKRWSDHAVAVEWDLSRFEGRALRLYVVDAFSNHYGQIAVSEISIRERAQK